MESIAAVYVRVSSMAQVEGRSLEGQVDDLKRAAAGRGLTVPDDLVFVEEGVSGTHATRPQFDRMLDAARAGRFGTLLIWKLSRFARNARAALNSLYELQELHVSVVFIQDGLDTSSQIVRAVVLPVMAGFAEMESESIAAQSMLGKWTGARAGAWVSGSGPFGFRTVGEAHARQLEADTEPWDGAGGRSAVEVVQLAFRLCVEEGLGPFQVAQRLNALEIPPPAAWPRNQRRARQRTGWEHGTVDKLLRDESYVGRAAFGRTTRVKPSPELIEARRRRGHPRPEEKVKVLAPRDRVLRIDVPCLVDADVFLAAQQRLSVPDPRRRSHSKRLYLLTGGRTVCGRCGRDYYGLTKGKYSYMVCSGTAPRIPEAERCDGPRLRTDDTEERVWRRVVELLDDKDGQLYALVQRDLPVGPAADGDVAAAVEAAEAKLAELEAELRRLALAIRRGTMPDDVADESIREVDAERGTVRQELRRLRAASAGKDSFEQFLRVVRAVVGERESLDSASTEEKDRRLRDLAVKVTVLLDGSLDIFMVLPMSASEVEAQREAEWQERMAATYENLPANVPPTGFEPVLPP